MRIESAGVVRATSPSGAVGLMQIMPATWNELSGRYHLGPDPYRARSNILAGAAYMRELLDRYGAPDFLAAYNAGPACLDDHLATHRPLPSETRRYVTALDRELVELPTTDRAAAADRVSNVHRARRRAAAVQAASTHANDLFVRPLCVSAAADVQRDRSTNRRSDDANGDESRTEAGAHNELLAVQRCLRSRS
jgi:hypothetical protein